MHNPMSWEQTTKKKIKGGMIPLDRGRTKEPGHEKCKNHSLKTPRAENANA